MYLLSYERLEAILSRIPSLRIAVIGDFFLDKYLVTDPILSERSVETGLEARQVVEIRCSPGAAGTVTNNLSTLGVGHIHAVGVAGDDGEGYEMRRGLEKTRVDTSLLVAAGNRFTPTYTKPMVRTAGGETELERLDIKNRTPLPRKHEQNLVKTLTLLTNGGFDAVVALDQVQERNCGVVTDAVRQALGEVAKRFPGLVCFADSRVRIGEFQNVTIKPNAYEAARALDPDWTGDVSLAQAHEIGRELARRNGKTVFLTVGEHGILACEPDSVEHVPTLPADGPIDIVGAGDSTTAGIVCALCAGATSVEAAALGNLCASITIRKLGTTGTTSTDELRERLRLGPAAD